MPDGSAADNGIGRTCRAWVSTLGWACYLACSWTWCIGMFLPVLLVRDYGLWGFVVFAVPNVVGAAAMGWVLRRKGSARLVREHYAAMTLFSLVTILFHGFFICWPMVWLERSAHVNGWLIRAVPVLAAVSALLLRRRASAAIVYLVSLGCVAVFVSRGPPPTGETITWTTSVGNLSCIAMTCLFGFALCPYLDLTFHGTIEEGRTVQESRGAFSAGFGALFPVMILFTLWYAATLVMGGASPTALMALGTHLLVQSGYTVGLHAGASWRRAGRVGPAIACIALAVFAFLPLLTPLGTTRGYIQLMMEPVEESIYRVFMGFYGLAFPGYVWICVIPTRGGHTGLAGPIRRRKLLTWAFAVGVAAPMFWMGFIERQEWWLAPGLAVVILARAVIPGGLGFGRLPPRPSDEQGPAPTGPMPAP